MKSIFNRQLLKLVPGLAIIGAILASLYFFNVKNPRLSIKEIETKSMEFINTEMLQGKDAATVKVVGEESGLYKLEVIYNGQKRESFVSKDGKRLFPQSFEIAKGTNTASNGQTTPVANVVTKNDKPVVELFVMSHCPYGLQMEKGILPVVKTLGDKIDFKIKFSDYAMHGEKELKEQLKQYCIQKEQPTKFLAYLECFAKEGDEGAANCAKTTGVDNKKNEDCVAAADKEYRVLDNFGKKIGFKGSYPGFEIFKSDNEKYGVAGSPTLIINGAQSKSGRDSKSLLASICSAFNNPPEECSVALSGENPAPGFGAGTTSSSSGSTGGGCH